MTEVPLLNKNPLDQLALKALVDLGLEREEINPDGPYSLQLVVWLLENNPEFVPLPAAKFWDQLLDNAHLMSSWKPESILRALVIHEEGEPLSESVSSLAQQHQKSSPAELASD